MNSLRKLSHSLAQLSLNNLLPVPLPLVPRFNKFSLPVTVRVGNFQSPDEIGSQTITLPWQMTNCPSRPDLFHWAVVYYRAGLRAGNASSKNRGRVSGGGRKIYKQKGTGRARAGSSRAPQRRGGGVCFGPRPRDFSQELPLRIRNRALFSALAMKYRLGMLKMVTSESLLLDSFKTSAFSKLLQKYRCKKILIVDFGEFSKNLSLASRSLTRQVSLFDCSNKELPCHAIMNTNMIIMTPRAAESLIAKFK